jgi:hypothetical protein
MQVHARSGEGARWHERRECWGRSHGVEGCRVRVRCRRREGASERNRDGIRTPGRGDVGVRLRIAHGGGGDDVGLGGDGGAGGAGLGRGERARHGKPRPAREEAERKWPMRMVRLAQQYLAAHGFAENTLYMHMLCCSYAELAFFFRQRLANFCVHPTTS